MGCGQSDGRAFSIERYTDLKGYAQDIIDVCEELELRDAVLVGHSVSAMTGLMAAIDSPHLISKLVMVCPSPSFLNDPPHYHGGFEREDLEGLIQLMDENYIGWANHLAPLVTGTSGAGLAQELSDSFCSTDPLFAKTFARATFFSDCRDLLSQAEQPTLIYQSSEDALADVSVAEFRGWDPETFVGQHIDRLFNNAMRLFCETYVIPTVINEGICSEVRVSLAKAGGGTLPKVASVRLAPNGTLVWVFLEVEKRNRLFRQLEDARYALQEQREHLQHLARTDPLTGLANRRALEASALGILRKARGSGASVSVLMLDVDRFKSVNDTYGHQVGDQVLCALADRLKSVCGDDSIAARLGGDEFVCVLSETDLEQACLLSQRIRRDLGSAVIEGCRITVSIGVTEIAVSAEMAFSDLLSLADAALYAAKRLGRNRVHFAQAPAA